jgi:hypothetical protein
MNITNVEWKMVYAYQHYRLVFEHAAKVYYSSKYLDVYFFVTLVGAVMTHEGIRQWAP